MKRLASLQAALLVTGALTSCALFGPSRADVDARTAPALELMAKKDYRGALAEAKRLTSLPVYDWWYGDTTYGQLCDGLVEALTLEPVRTAQGQERTREKDEAALAAIALVEGLPLDRFERGQQLLETKSQIEARMKQRIETAAQQLTALRAERASPWPGAAWYAWAAFPSMTPAQDQERQEALDELAHRFFLSVQMKVAVKAAPGSHESIAEAVQRVVQAGPGSSLAVVPEEQATAVVVVAGEAPVVRQTKGQVTLEHRYVSGRREVPNPAWAERRKRVEELEEKAADAKRRFDQIRCTGKSAKYPASNCAKAEGQAFERYSKDAQAERKRLAGTKQTKVELTYSTHSYEAQEEKLTSEQPLRIEVHFSDGREPLGMKLSAEVTFVAYTHPGNAAVRLEARAQKLPDEQALLAAMRTARLSRLDRFFRELSANESKTLAGKVPDGPGAAAERELLKRGASWNEAPAEAVRKFVEERLREPRRPLPRPVEAWNHGARVDTFARVAAFAEAEEAAGRPLAAAVAWSSAPMGTAKEALRTRKLEALKPRAVAVVELSMLIRPPNAPIAARVRQLLSPAAVPVGPLDPELLVAIEAPVPTVKRESRGAVELVHTFKGGDEDDPVTETGTYRAEIDEVTVEGQVEVTVRSEDRPQPTAITVPVTVKQEFVRHPAQPELQLPARADRIPDDASLAKVWEAEAARAVFDAVVATAGASTGEGLGPELERALVKVARRAKLLRAPFPGDGSLLDAAQPLDAALPGPSWARVSAQRFLPVLFPRFFPQPPGNGQEPRSSR